MQTNFQDIREFHEFFGLEYDGDPRHLPPELQLFRIAFMQEELNEYIRAVLAEDLEKQVDALVDLVYVALGTAYLQGFRWEPHWEQVHEANMRKVRATSKEQSARSSTADVIKPSGWTPPDHISVFELYRAKST